MYPIQLNNKITVSFQALVSFRRYVFSLENLLEVAMIVSSFYLILAAGSPVSNVRKPLSSAVILMAWTEMVLMFGRHPALSTYIAMLARYISLVPYNLLLMQYFQNPPISFELIKK